MWLSGWNAVHNAARFNRIEIVILLLAMNTQMLDSRTAWGHTALIICAQSNHIELARGLLDRGANVHARWNGWDALMHATSWGYLELCTLLLDRGADPNSRHTRWTALGLAAYYDRLEVCLLLIARGADLRAVMTGWRGIGERTALQWYGERRSLRPAILKKRRAALSAASPPPHTPAAPDGVRVLLGGARLEPLAQRRQERGQQLLGKAGRKLAPPNRGTRREA